MLKIYILNVGHGNSAIIEYIFPRGRAIGVIDSNQINGTIPVLSKLEELEVDKISFIALTHPHKDHFTGLTKVIKKYRNIKLINFIYFLLVATHKDDCMKLERYIKKYIIILIAEQSKDNLKNLLNSLR